MTLRNTNLTGFGAFTASGASLGGNSIAYTLTTDGGGGNAGDTFRSVIAAAAFGGISGTAVRVTFTGHSGSGMTITKAYIGPSAGAGDAYDASALTALTFNGGSAGAVVAAGVPKATDTVAFILDPAKDHIISWIFSAGDLRYKGSATANHRQFYLNATDEAATADATTGYTEDAAAEPYGLSLVEW